MPVPTTMADLSTTAASNSPAGGDAVGPQLDDYLRGIQAILRHTNAKGSDIASASTIDLGAATGEFVDVTGTTTITSLGTVSAGIVRTVRFTGSLTLTHNATSLILPGGVNIKTSANDIAVFISLGAGNWVCVNYPPTAGTYTPTITLGDLSSATANTAIYTRAGAAVTVFGGISGVSFSDSGTVSFRVSLPIASDIGTLYGEFTVINTLIPGTTTYRFEFITGDITNNNANFTFYATGGIADAFIRYQFCYLVQ